MTQSENVKNYKYLNFIATTFVVLLITSNLGATKLALFGSFVMPAAIFIFPMLYILNDILTEVYGFSVSRRVIWTALIFNMFVTLALYFMTHLPPAPQHSNQESFAQIFSFAPRIVIASVVSYFFGELLNAYILSNLKIKLNGKSFAIRAILSTLIGALLETSIFGSIAFGNFMSTPMLIEFIITLTSIKVIYEFLSLPFSIAITKYLKKAEGVDSFEKPSIAAIFKMKI